MRVCQPSPGAPDLREQDPDPPGSSASRAHRFDGPTRGSHWRRSRVRPPSSGLAPAPRRRRVPPPRRRAGAGRGPRLRQEPWVTGPAMAAVAASSSSGVANWSRVPETNRQGTSMAAKCSVRSLSGLPGRVEGVAHKHAARPRAGPSATAIEHMRPPIERPPRATRALRQAAHRPRKRRRRPRRWLPAQVGDQVAAGRRGGRGSRCARRVRPRPSPLRRSRQGRSGPARRSPPGLTRGRPPPGRSCSSSFFFLCVARGAGFPPGRLGVLAGASTLGGAGCDRSAGARRSPTRPTLQAHRGEELQLPRGAVAPLFALRPRSSGSKRSAPATPLASTAQSWSWRHGSGSSR